MPLNPLLKALREEIYVEKFSEIDFSKNRNNVAPSDLKQPHSLLLRIINLGLRLWDSYLMPTWLKERANRTVRALIKREDENTSYSCLAPVNKAFHMVAIYFADGPDRSCLAKHHQKIETFLWKNAEGMTCSGTNGVQVWDTAFSVQAAVEAGIANETAYKDTLQKALEFLDMSQIRDDLVDPHRQKRKGGWPFSSKDNGYIVSDCAAESMKAVIMLQEEW
jgi:lanosterol synthase